MVFLVCLHYVYMYIYIFCLERRLPCCLQVHPDAAPVQRVAARVVFADSHWRSLILYHDLAVAALRSCEEQHLPEPLVDNEGFRKFMLGVLRNGLWAAK